MQSDIRKELIKGIFAIRTQGEFEDMALRVFSYQCGNNELYRTYLDILGIDPSSVDRISRIPCLPVSFFKTHAVYTGTAPGEKVFRSSGTGRGSGAANPGSGNTSGNSRTGDGSRAANPETGFPSGSSGTGSANPGSGNTSGNSRTGDGSRVASSGTAPAVRSAHYVADTALYEKSYLRCFEIFYGDPAGYCFLALLPSYLERGDSSLVYMAGGLIRKSGRPESGFYLDDLDSLASVIRSNEKRGIKTFLLGVSFALLDLFGRYGFRLGNTIVAETGGMKGKRKEITREELHDLIRRGSGLQHIHSEYGMTELLSQAWSRSGGIFHTPPWMKVMIRDAYDPFSCLEQGRSGGVNIIDLANIDSCAFIETADLGRMHPGGGFEILGRFDNADLRGCNLLSE
ncbi:MAG: acyl transferase [Marinilabiliales bacterium]|nr:MAG: acyl transferase [Marinilabiliales bacterium]